MEGKGLLRDVIDLDATYGGGPDSEGIVAPVNGAGLPAAADSDDDEEIGMKRNEYLSSYMYIYI